MLPQYLHCSLHLTWYPQHCSNTCGSRSPVSPEHLSNCLPQTQAWRNCENPKRGTIPAVKLTAKICSTCWLLLLEVDCVSVLCVSTPLPILCIQKTSISFTGFLIKPWLFLSINALTASPGSNSKPRKRPFDSQWFPHVKNTKQEDLDLRLAKKCGNSRLAAAWSCSPNRRLAGSPAPAPVTAWPSEPQRLPKPQKRLGEPDLSRWSLKAQRLRSVPLFTFNLVTDHILFGLAYTDFYRQGTAILLQENHLAGKHFLEVRKGHFDKGEASLAQKRSTWRQGPRKKLLFWYQKKTWGA